MEKVTAISYGGTNSSVGDLLVNRLLPNRYVDAVGPFIFLDHLYPTELNPEAPEVPTGESAHPHRGIATFSYLFKGSLAHFDSQGHRGTVASGGIQWMKAGNGIIHDEHPSVTAVGGSVLHALQFWINLPAKNKAEAPEYLAVQADEIPEVILPNDAGIVRILIGELGCQVSPVKTFSRQFLYHVKLNPKSSFTLPTRSDFEYAAFVPSDEVNVNGSMLGNSKLLTFEMDGGDIVLQSDRIASTDVMLFGGEPYTEPIVAEGPFVMNTHLEIADAYRDFFNGKYGTIKYTA
jgi:redox-sensitive bicupin YhaK (pirin superfamily)